MKILRRADLIRLLEEEAERAGSMRALAEKIGISESFLSLVKSGERGPGIRLPKALGLEIVYTPRRRS